MKARKMISILLVSVFLCCPAFNVCSETAEPETASAGGLADFGIDPEEALGKMNRRIGETKKTVVILERK